jgi:hypothetical protein
MEDLLKSISEDQTHIDYTRGNFGIRVWQYQCEAIARTGPNSTWLRRGEARALPVDDRFNNLAADTVPALAFEIARLASDELTALVRGEMTLAAAISGPLG